MQELHPVVDMLTPFFRVFQLVLELYSYVLFAWIILSWLLAFNIINGHNPFVRKLIDILVRATDPVLRPIRSRMPNLEGLDISPIIVFFGIYFLIMMLPKILNLINFMLVG